MEIEEFKKLVKENKKEAMLYDFKDNIDECNKNNLEKYKKDVQILVENIENSKTNIEKLMNYKQYSKNTSKILFDCDSCNLTMEIFKKCFKFLNNGEIQYQWMPKIKSSEKNRRGFTKEIIVYNEEYTGDTMNSFQTVANCATKKIGKESIEKIEDLPKEIKKKFEKFASLTHTIGNFIPVPKGSFNCNRYFPTYDFWDITLECIRNYYLNTVEHTPLYSILFCDKNNSKWLNQFGEGLKGWKNFIDENFLIMYVEGSDYTVIQLFVGHNFENILPQTPEQIIQFLDNVCDKIELRGKNICDKLNSN